MFSFAAGFKILMDVFGCVTGPVDECVKILKVRENQNYSH